MTDFARAEIQLRPGGCELRLTVFVILAEQTRQQYHWMVKTLDGCQCSPLPLAAAPNITKEVADLHLGNHTCLDLDNLQHQMLGGPVGGVNGTQCRLSLYIKQEIKADERSHLDTNTALVCWKKDC